MANDFAARKDRTVRTEKVGREENPVIVIDDYMASPDAMVDFASSTANFTAPNNWYPGLRAQPLPQEYVIEVIRALHGVIAETFGLPAKGDVDANAYFGLATVSPENLSTLQRLPHFDTSNPRQVAVLHYLCNESHGGTSFFRHRSTGYESIGSDRERAYYAALERELAASGPPPARYISGDDDRFEEIARFNARFNRMIVYRSLVLHSGNVNPAAGLSRDPRHGRLTANVFLAYR